MDVVLFDTDTGVDISLAWVSGATSAAGDSPHPSARGQKKLPPISFASKQNILLKMYHAPIGSYISSSSLLGPESLLNPNAYIHELRNSFDG